MKVTADDIAQLLASSPSRRVPAHVLKAAQGGKAPLLVLLFGLVFGGLGTVFLFIFFPWRFVDEWRLAAGGTEVSGVVLDISKANMSVNDVDVLVYRFAYTPKSGDSRLTAECFTTGSQWNTNAEVTVRYLQSDPKIACIAGARLNKAGLGAAFVVIFPVVGLGVMVWAIGGRRTAARMLREGQVAEVDVQALEATRVQVNYQTLYKITLSPLPGTDGQPVTIKRWARPEINLLTQHSLDKQPVFVLYDPRKPKNLLFPEVLIEP